MDDYPDDPMIRDCVVRRGAKGFGFNIKGTTQLGGTMSSIGGVLYPPLQYVSAVDEGGAAFEGGIRLWDRILAVNGVDVRGANHQRVVECVLRGGDNLNLKVVRVTEEEADRLRIIEEGGDKSKIKSKKTYSVNGYEEKTDAGGKAFTVYHVRDNQGNVVVSKRYSEFDALHKKLTNRFRIFTLPQLPPKKMNGFLKATLNKRETEQRCAKLNAYIQELLLTEDIAKSEAIKTFLEIKPEGDLNPDRNDSNESSGGKTLDEEVNEGRRAADEVKADDKKEKKSNDGGDDEALEEETEKKKSTEASSPLFSNIRLDEDD